MTTATARRIEAAQRLAADAGATAGERAAALAAIERIRAALPPARCEPVAHATLLNDGISDSEWRSLHEAIMVEMKRRRGRLPAGQQIWLHQIADYRGALTLADWARLRDVANKLGV